MTKDQLDALRQHLAQHLPGTVDVIVSSPPFGTGDSASAQSLVRRTDKSATWIKTHVGSSAVEGYGDAPGQMAELPLGDLDAVIKDSRGK